MEFTILIVLALCCRSLLRALAVAAAFIPLVILWALFWMSVIIALVGT